MNKGEFIEKLGEALAGEVVQSVIQENIRYYDNYISGEVRNGSREEDVIAAIGDPRLIARTIIDSTAVAEESGSYGGEGYTNYNQQSTTDTNSTFKTFDLSKWYWKAALIAIIFVVISLVITVVGGIFSLLAPFVFPIMIIWFVFSLLRGPRR